MSTHNICFLREIRKLFSWYPFLSRPMCEYSVEQCMEYTCFVGICQHWRSRSAHTIHNFSHRPPSPTHSLLWEKLWIILTCRPQKILLIFQGNTDNCFSCSTGNLVQQEAVGLIPARSGNILSLLKHQWNFIHTSSMMHPALRDWPLLTLTFSFYSLYAVDLRKAVVSFWWKNMHKYWLTA